MRSHSRHITQSVKIWFRKTVALYNKKEEPDPSINEPGSPISAVKRKKLSEVFTSLNIGQYISFSYRLSLFDVDFNDTSAEVR